MLDVTYIRARAELVKKGMREKGEENPEIVDQLLDVDKAWRSLVTQTDDLRNESNTKAGKIGQLMGQGKQEEARELITHTSKLKDEIRQKEEQLNSLKQRRSDLLLRIPNVPHESVPVGHSEKDNEIVRTWGEPEGGEEWRRPHWKLAEEHGWTDFKRGAKVTGAGFPFYLGPIARLQRALINYFLDQAGQRGYTELQRSEERRVGKEGSARGASDGAQKRDRV